MGASQSRELPLGSDNTALPQHVDESISDVPPVTTELNQTETEPLREEEIIKENEPEQNIREIMLTNENKRLQTHINNVGKQLVSLNQLLQECTNDGEEDEEKLVIVGVNLKLQQYQCSIEKYVEKYNTLKAEYSRVQSELQCYKTNEVCVNKELNTLREQIKASSEECQRKNAEYDQTYNALNDEYSKVLQELVNYKFVDCTDTFSALTEQLRKFDSEVDASAMRRITNDKELKRLLLDCDQRRNILQQHKILYTSSQRFETAMEKYKDAYEENNRKTKDIVKRMRGIYSDTETISKQLNTNISNNIADNLKEIMEECQDKLDELKNNFSSTDFGEEMILYEASLQRIEEQNFHIDSLFDIVHSNNLENNEELDIPEIPRKDFQNTHVGVETDEE